MKRWVTPSTGGLGRLQQSDFDGGMQRGERGSPDYASGCFYNRLHTFLRRKPWEARRSVELRDRWLNPPEWVEWVDEPVPGYPKWPSPRDEEAARALKKRTLTYLYNTRPQCLVDAHAALDAAVAGAYGWFAYMSDQEVVRELLALNGGGR